MKFFIRTFFKALRVSIGPVMLLGEIVTRPKGLVRQPALQEQVDQQCQKIVLYQFKTCPFCIKVRQEIRRLSLKIDHLDVQQEGKDREELMHKTGLTKVPCLKITDQAGNSQWLHESGAIIAYLRGRFATG
jgi:glutaredoxin